MKYLPFLLAKIHKTLFSAVFRPTDLGHHVPITALQHAAAALIHTEEAFIKWGFQPSRKVLIFIQLYVRKPLKTVLAVFRYQIWDTL